MNRELYQNGFLVERADDATRTFTTYDESGEVTSTRPYTAEENAQADAQAAAEQTQQVQDQLKADTTADLTKLTQAITDLQTVLGDNTTEGSLRAWRTGVTNQHSAGHLRALVDVLLTEAQATRRIARQVLRLARVMAEDYSSADVGTE